MKKKLLNSSYSCISAVDMSGSKWVNLHLSLFEKFILFLFYNCFKKYHNLVYFSIFERYFAIGYHLTDDDFDEGGDINA